MRASAKQEGTAARKSGEIEGIHSLWKDISRHFVHFEMRWL